MKFFYLFGRMVVASSISFIAWFILLFGFNQSFWLSTSLALSGGVVLFCALQCYSHYTFLKKHRLTWKEYAYIRRNLHEAKGKIRRLRKTLMNVRSIRAFRQTVTTHRLVKRIYTIVKKEPKRFYQAERFFFYHLDSMVELTEKHAFLTAQSVHDRKRLQSLHETQRMIDTLIQSVEKDLYDLLSTDVDQLEFELDVAKRSLKMWSLPLDERRSEK